MGPRVKRYLRIYDLFSNCSNLQSAHDLDKFIAKYAKLYPKNLNLEERFNAKRVDVNYISTFYLIPALKRRLTNLDDFELMDYRKP